MIVLLTTNYLMSMTFKVSERSYYLYDLKVKYYILQVLIVNYYNIEVQ